MKPGLLFRWSALLVSLFISNSNFSQEVDYQYFGNASSKEKARLIQSYELETLSPAVFLTVYDSLSFYCCKEDEWLPEWWLKYYYFLQRLHLEVPPEKRLRLLDELINLAKEHNYQGGLLTANHYLFFEEYYCGKLKHGLLYTHVLKEIEEMEEFGLNRLVSHGIDEMLYHNGRFLYELDDYEKAEQIFKKAERFIIADNRHKKPYVLILNHLQSINQKKGDIEGGIFYAKIILDFVNNAESSEPDVQTFYRQWRGLASTDLASMYAQSGELEQSKKYAQDGYEFSKADNNKDRIELQLEYDALQVLVATKLGLGELSESVGLLKRLDEIYDLIGEEEDYYFNNIEYFDLRAKYHELKGEFEKSIWFSKRAQPLKDSLSRRNDARALEQLKQRLDAEKYQAKINFVEQERELQKWLRNAAIFILILVLILAYALVNRQQILRKQQQDELEKANKDLKKLKEEFKKKSDMAAKLRFEIDKLAESGERSEYLEQLTQSTILTDDDWLNFRLVFEKAHPGFLEYQKDICPDITPAELRYLALEKLGLSTTEMANMLGVSPNAVRKTRGRVKKRMEG